MYSEKQDIRKAVSNRREALCREQVAFASTRIVRAIEKSPKFVSAQHILLYYPIQNEVDLLPLWEKWRATKLFYLPIIEKGAFHIGLFESKAHLTVDRYGIPTPTCRTTQCPDLVLVPGVAFDLQKNRMGRGGGYYDRYLANGRSCAIGIGYDFQLLTSLPTERHDIGMDMVITPNRIVE